MFFFYKGDKWLGKVFREDGRCESFGEELDEGGILGEGVELKCFFFWYFFNGERVDNLCYKC